MRRKIKQNPDESGKDDEDVTVQYTSEISEARAKLESMLTLSQYHCVVVQLERSMDSVFRKIEDKYYILKMRAFYNIKTEGSHAIAMARMKAEMIISEKLIKLFNVKLINHRMEAFYLIRMRAAKNKKMKKFNMAEIDLSQASDEDISKKMKELELLTNKYNRLIQEFEILNSRLKQHRNKS